mmetsp:Transcript_42804/g.48637  ORF Transcript_42804/g.48637 Transcript_42804/m.48637 type:complete len:149 (+) Transcript_42804:34-480(+)
MTAAPKSISLTALLLLLLVCSSGTNAAAIKDEKKEVNLRHSLNRIQLATGTDIGEEEVSATTKTTEKEEAQSAPFESEKNNVNLVRRRLGGNDFFKHMSMGEMGAASGVFFLLAIVCILYCCCGCSCMDMLLLFCCYEYCCDGPVGFG